MGSSVTPQVCLKQADEFLALGRKRPTVAWLCAELAREWQRTAAELAQRDGPVDIQDGRPQG